MDQINVRHTSPLRKGMSAVANRIFARPGEDVALSFEVFGETGKPLPDLYISTSLDGGNYVLVNRILPTLLVGHHVRPMLKKTGLSYRHMKVTDKGLEVFIKGFETAALQKGATLALTLVFDKFRSNRRLESNFVGWKGKLVFI